MQLLSSLKQREDILAESWAIELGESLPLEKIDIDEVATTLLETLSTQFDFHCNILSNEEALTFIADVTRTYGPIRPNYVQDGVIVLTDA
jgi:hypothetical protein